MEELDPSKESILRLLNFANTNNITSIITKILPLLDHPYFRLCSEIYSESNNKTEASSRYRKVVKDKSLLPDESSMYYNIAISLNTGLMGGGYARKMSTTTMDAYTDFVFNSMAEDLLDPYIFIDIVNDSISDKKRLLKYEIIQQIASKKKISGKSAGYFYINIIETLKDTEPMKLFLTELYKEDIATSKFVSRFLEKRSVKDLIDRAI